MKNRNVLNMLFGGLTLLPVMAFAQAGHVGGGDTCRDEINKHRETLYQWIQSGDASDLDFSQSKTEVRDFAEYQKRMLGVLQSGKVVVTCYLDPARISDPAAQKIASEQKVSYRAITLTNPTTGQQEPTACINYEDKTGISHIDCNYDSIVNQKSLEDPNYQLTHHEYASVAGVELRKTDSEPDFTISRQLSQYEQWIKVKRLGKKASNHSIHVLTSCSKPTAGWNYDLSIVFKNNSITAELKKVFKSKRNNQYMQGNSMEAKIYGLKRDIGNIFKRKSKVVSSEIMLLSLDRLTLSSEDSGTYQIQHWFPGTKVIINGNLTFDSTGRANGNVTLIPVSEIGLLDWSKAMPLLCM